MAEGVISTLPTVVTFLVVGIGMYLYLRYKDKW